MPTIPGVVGTVDNQPPIYEPSARWCWWSIKEIFTGSTGSGKYIPKVLDFVMDPDTYTAYVVEALDPNTYVPTLVKKNPGNMDLTFSETDVLFGVGPGTQADTYRVYLDKTKTPFTLAVDTRLRVGGTMSAYCKIFRGSTVDNSGKVISKIYDSNGQYISENVPLQLAAIDSHVNYSIKVVDICKTTETMPDGEIVTAVFYDVTGAVVSKRQLMVENTSFIRDLNVSKKYVTGISLKSPFLSPSIEHQIDFPLNVPMNALNLIGVVSYSDGTTMELPCDGTKFTMFGLSQVISSIVGQKVDLVLRYALADGETAYTGVMDKYVTAPYTLVNVNPNNSYTVKLFGYPYWLNDAVGYQMRWWMLNLDRNLWFDVTDKVIFNANTGPFNPKAYGYLQQKSISINLKNVSGAFKPFIHTQMVEITLNNPPDNVHTSWLMSQEASVTRPAYGQDLFAKRMSDNTINLNSGIVTFDEWNSRVYLNTYPLVNPATEIIPMSPTHFVVNYNGLDTEFPITDWNVDLNVGNGITQYSTVSIRFMKRTASGDLQLAIAAIVVFI